MDLNVYFVYLIFFFFKEKKICQLVNFLGCVKVLCPHKLT